MPQASTVTKPASKQKRSLVKMGLAEFGACPLIELKLRNAEAMVDTFDAVTKADLQVSEGELIQKNAPLVRIMTRETAEHERKGFECKYEYGFREK